MMRSTVGILVAVLLAQLGATAGATVAEEFAYLVGRGKADITGPPVGVPIWGFGRPDQLTQGIHFRQWARAFIVAERQSDRRLVFVVCDLGSVTHSIQLEVVERLGARYGPLYDQTNVLVAATHTHAAPGGYWHYGSGTPLGSPFHRQYFDAIVDGIVEAVTAAHEDLEPGDVRLARGEVENAGAQRSAVAYLANPAEERARYPHDTDREMTLLELVDASGPIAAINWFAVHPTSMTFDNHDISGDHKGRAAARLEAERGEGFVAAFAQSNCGDVTANLNLDNTGPGGDDDFENVRIIAERQLEVAQRLLNEGGERLTGPIDYRHAFVDFTYLPVDGTFTGAGPQTTCPSAYGYSFAAGSTEDGGGFPLAHEGMLDRDEQIDNLARTMLGAEPPSERLRACHLPKPILLAVGEMKPHPAQAQIVPITLARVGRLALIAVPAEVTTMAGRRLRRSVLAALEPGAQHAVVVGYANDYAGYVTTREEYGTQQYEGGHTLFGPFTLAAYQQELVRLAGDLSAGRPTERGSPPRDVRRGATDTPLGSGDDRLPEGAEFGELVEALPDRVTPGTRVQARFWAGNPRNDYRTGNNYLSVERRQDEGWIEVATDDDWSTLAEWESDEATGATRFVASWNIPVDAAPGAYRLLYHGSYSTGGRVHPLDAVSPAFRVEARASTPPTPP